MIVEIRQYRVIMPVLLNPDRIETVVMGVVPAEETDSRVEKSGDFDVTGSNRNTLASLYAPAIIEWERLRSRRRQLVAVLNGCEHLGDSRVRKSSQNTSQSSKMAGVDSGKMSAE